MRHSIRHSRQTLEKQDRQAERWWREFIEV